MDIRLMAQAIGAIAVIISLFVFQTNQRRTMLKLCMVSGILYAIHFFLLSAPTGAIMNLIGIGRAYTYGGITPNRRHISVLIVFSVLAIAGGIITWQGPLSLLPIGGFICNGIAYWHTEPKQIRRWALTASPLWFTYNAVSGSYPGMLIEVVMLCSNLLGEYRYDFRHKAHVQRRVARPG
jgi:inner membrane protein